LPQALPLDPFLGDIRSLEIAPDGTIWLWTSEGLATSIEGVWMLHPQEDSTLIGFDKAGRAWATFDKGQTISSWDGKAWTSYGEESGWTSTEVLRRAGPYSTVSEEIVIDGRGWTWLVTRQDVRVFDGQSWSIYGPEDVGYTPTEDMIEQGFWYWLVDLALDSTGDIWVTDCAWMGPGPVGQGARWFNGEEWQGQDSPVVATGCVMDIEIDDAGRIWAGVDGSLWRYTLGEGWTEFPHPDPNPEWGGRRWGWIASIDLAPQGIPWVVMSPCGGASCDSGIFVLFRVKDGTWTEIAGQSWGGLAFDASGGAWFCNNEGLHHVMEETRELYPLPGEGFCSVKTDPFGRLWLTVSDQPSLWVYDAAD
jgi:hypothetical protein